jgi:hypothetical protein
MKVEDNMTSDEATFFFSYLRKDQNAPSREVYKESRLKSHHSSVKSTTLQT